MKTIPRIFLIVCINVLLATLLTGVIAVKMASAQSPYPQWITYYHNAPLMSNYEYGKLNQLLDIYKLKYDGTSEYDWYFYLGAPGSTGMQHQAVPGIAAWPGDSFWRTYTIGCAFYVYAASPERDLVDWGPETTDGLWSAGATASISPTGGGFGFSASYQIPYVKVTSYCQADIHKAAWLHEYNYFYDTSETSHTTRPYFVIMTAQDWPSLIDAQFATRWRAPWVYSDQFFSSWQAFDAIQYGDDW